MSTHTVDDREKTASNFRAIMPEYAEVISLGSGSGYQVEFGEKVLARFPTGERANALDFANGFNLGIVHARVNGTPRRRK